MRLVRAIALEAPDDHVWVAAVLAGDAAGFRVLFDRHAAAVRRFVRDLGRDEGLADEVTQGTSVRGRARLATLRDGQRLRPWLLGIARRVWLEEVRLRRPRTRLDEVTDHAPSPETGVLAAEQVRVFRAALGQLSAT